MPIAIERRLKDGTIVLRRDDDAIFFKRPDGTLLDEKGVRVDIPGAPVPPEQRRAVPAGVTTTFEPESLLPAAGAIVGGIAGGVSPISIPLAGLGGALGEEARIAAQVARGRPSPTPLQILGKAGRVGAETAAAEAAGLGIFKGLLAPVGRRAARFIGGEISPADLATLRVAEREGITLPLSARTESPALQSMEAALLKVPGGRKLVEQRRLAEIGTERFARRFAEKFGKPITKEEAGITIKESFENAIKNKNELSKQLYEKLDNVAGHVPVAAESATKEFIEDFMAARGIVPAGPKGLPAGIKKQIGEQIGLTGGKLESTLASVDPKEFDFLQRILLDLEKPDLTFTQLKQIRTLVGDRADFESVKATGFEAVYKKVYGTITEDMDRTAKAAGFGEIADEAKTFYKQFLDFAKSPSARLIKKSQNPEKLIDSLVQSNNETTVRAIMKEFDGKGQNALRRGYLDKIFEESIDETRTGFNISIEILSRKLNRPSDGVVKALYGEDAHIFNEVKDIANAMRRGEKLRAGSPTAFLMETLAIIKGGAWRFLSRMGVSGALKEESVKRLLTQGTPVEVPGVRAGLRLGVQAVRSPLDIIRQQQEQEQAVR